MENESCKADLNDNKIYCELLQKAFNLMKKVPNVNRYHDYKHARCVHRSILELTKDAPLKFQRKAALAAAFHDTGHIVSWYNHEKMSASIFKNCLRDGYKENLDFEDEDIDEIANAIKATSFFVTPKDPLDFYLRDADLCSLGYRGFSQTSEDLRTEMLNTKDHPMHKQSLYQITWLEAQINFLEGHKWLTHEAKNLYNKQKTKNIDNLKRILERIKQGNA